MFLSRQQAQSDEVWCYKSGCQEAGPLVKVKHTAPYSRVGLIGSVNRECRPGINSPRQLECVGRPGWRRRDVRTVTPAPSLNAV